MFRAFVLSFWWFEEVSLNLISGPFHLLSGFVPFFECSPAVLKLPMPIASLKNRSATTISFTTQATWVKVETKGVCAVTVFIKLILVFKNLIVDHIPVVFNLEITGKLLNFQLQLSYFCTVFGIYESGKVIEQSSIHVIPY